jgi:uncharacterized protein (DUF1330 family)
MAAYVIVETDITDPERYERYKAASPGAVAAGGGRFLARGGAMDMLEGDWRPPRLVILEFEDLAAARRWYDSEIYRQARAFREGAARIRMVAVQGVEASPGG